MGWKRLWLVSHHSQCRRVWGTVLRQNCFSLFSYSSLLGGLDADSLVLLAPAAVCGPGVCGACGGLKFWILRCGWLVRSFWAVLRGTVGCRACASVCERSGFRLPSAGLPRLWTPSVTVIVCCRDRESWVLVGLKRSSSYMYVVCIMYA